MKLVRRLLLGMFSIYHKVVSPMTRQRCNYYPTCSHYAEQAIERYGILRGLVLSSWRIMRCNPWSRGGVDLVESQRLFKPRGRAASA